VVGGGDQDRVDVLAGAQLPEVLEDRAALAAPLALGLGLLGVLLAGVADGDDLDVAHPAKGAEIAAALAADADAAQDDPPAGGGAAVLAEGGGGNDDRGGDGRRPLEEPPPRHPPDPVHHGLPFPVEPLLI